MDVFANFFTGIFSGEKIIMDRYRDIRYMLIPNFAIELMLEIPI